MIHLHLRIGTQTGQPVVFCPCAVMSMVWYFCTLKLPALRLMRSVWWTLLSIPAGEMVRSPKTSPQRANGTFEVRIHEACSQRLETSWKNRRAAHCPKGMRTVGAEANCNSHLPAIKTMERVPHTLHQTPD